ncbi:hypothetical protein T08_12380 [Trichinella sp. T8]|nr:hypothetical protein T08_12380 [Trichinella sp. T8]
MRFDVQVASNVCTKQRRRHRLLPAITIIRHSARIVILSSSWRIGCLMLVYIEKFPIYNKRQPELSIVGDAFLNFASVVMLDRTGEKPWNICCREFVDLMDCLKFHSARNSTGNVACTTRAMENFDNLKKKELFTSTNHSPPSSRAS